MTFDETALQQPGGNAPAPVAYDPNEFWLRMLLRWYIGLVIRPSPTIREIVERRPLLAGVGTAVVGSAMSVVVYDAAYQLLEFQSLSIDQVNSGEVQVGLVAIPLWCALIVSAFTLWSLVIHWIAERFGNRASFQKTFSAMLVISAILFAVFSSGILAASLIIDPGSPRIFKDALHTVTNVTLALTVVGLLWICSLSATMVKEQYDLHIGKAALAVALSIIPTFVLGYVLLGLLLLAALFSGLASFV